MSYNARLNFYSVFLEKKEALSHQMYNDDTEETCARQRRRAKLSRPRVTLSFPRVYEFFIF